MKTEKWLRAIGTLSMAVGYASARVRMVVEAAKGLLVPQRGWRRLRVDGLEIRVPPSWGSPEADPQGGFVIHNRPAQHRIDGDAVWYSSAIELRILKLATPLPRSHGAMSVVERTIDCDEPVRVILAVANGVGARQRRTALQVLRNVRMVRHRKPVRWPITASRLRWPSRLRRTDNTTSLIAPLPACQDPDRVGRRPDD